MSVPVWALAHPLLFNLSVPAVGKAAARFPQQRKARCFNFPV
jgi:hypothetical protein